MPDGLLVEVAEDNRGSQTMAAAVAGDLVLEVEDVTDFPETGTIEIPGDTPLRYDYVEVTHDEAALLVPEVIDDDGTDAGSPEDAAPELIPATSGTLTLATALTADVEEDSPVWLVVADAPATDAYAIVDWPQGEAGDAPDGGDAMRVPLTYDQRITLTPGVYDPPMPVTLSDDLQQLTNVPGVRPVIDGSSIINLPDPGDLTPTDPPASSPAVVVHGTAEALVVEVTEDFAATTTIDFHLSTDPAFVPSDATLVGSARSSVYVITNTPAGTAAPADSSGDTATTAAASSTGSDGKLELDTIYFVRTVARNVVGAADPGTAASGQLDPSAVTNIVAARLVAGFVLAGAIEVGNITIDPVHGVVIPQSNGGTISFPADGSSAYIDAYIYARALSVEDDLAIKGYGELSADLVLTSGINAPLTAPTLTSAYAYTDLQKPSGVNFNDGSIHPIAEVNGRMLVVESGQLLGIYDWKTGTRLGQNDLSGALTSPEWIADMCVGPGPTSGSTKIYVLTCDGSSWYLNRFDASSGDYETYVTLGSAGYKTNALIECRLAMDQANKNVCLVFRRYDSNLARTGIQVSTRACDSSTMAVLGTTQNLTTDDNFNVMGACFSGRADANSSYLLALRMTSSSGALAALPAWSIYDGGTTVTFTRDSGGDMPLLTGLTTDNWAGGLSGKGPTGWDYAHEDTWILQTNGRLYRQSVPVAIPVTFAYTFYDGDTTGGTHETTASPSKSLTIPKCQWPVLQMAPAPEVGITDPARTDIADRIGLYGVQASSGTTYLQSYLPKGQNTIKAGDFNHFPGTGQWQNQYTAPTSNGFDGLTGATPGRIRSTVTDTKGPLVDLRGDSSWRLGDMSGNAAGITTFPMGSAKAYLEANVSTFPSTASSGAPGTVITSGWTNAAITGFTAISNGRWKVIYTGLYLMFLKHTFAADTTADWGTGIQVWADDAQLGNAGQIALHSKAIPNSSGTGILMPYRLTAGQELTMSIWQNSGAAKTANSIWLRLIHYGN